MISAAIRGISQGIGIMLGIMMCIIMLQFGGYVLETLQLKDSHEKRMEKLEKEYEREKERLCLGY